MSFLKYDWKMLQIIYMYHFVLWLFYSNEQAVNSKNTICFVWKIAGFLGDFWLEVASTDLKTLPNIWGSRTCDYDKA